MPSKVAGEPTEKRSFVKDLATYAPARLLPAVTAFITTPILTRLLPPAEYGYWSLVLGVSSFLVAVAGSGLGSAAIRFYPVYEAKATVNVFFATIGVSTAAVVTVLTGLSFLVLFLIKEWLPSWILPLLPLVILIFVAQSIFTVLTSVVRAQGRSGIFTASQLFTNYGGLGAGLLLLAAFGLRIDGLLLGTLLALLLALPFLLVLVTNKAGIHARDFHLSDARRMWQYAWPLALGNVAMWGGCEFPICSSSAHGGPSAMSGCIRFPTISPRRASNSWSRCSSSACHPWSTEGGKALAAKRLN